MNEIINIYCDESCHLEHDDSPVMVLGGVWLPKNKLKKICLDIREIKLKHSFSKSFEFKWSQISPKKIEFYKDLITYFFSNNDLCFRGLVASKQNLNHDKHSQSHDDWYYKMYYFMLLNIFKKEDEYNIYIDIKEKKRGGIKILQLKKILSNKLHDFDSKIIKKMQIVDSKDSELLQMSDLFCGALSYLNKDLKTSEAKLEILRHISKLSKCNLKIKTLPQEKKFNIFYWNGDREV